MGQVSAAFLFFSREGAWADSMNKFRERIRSSWSYFTAPINYCKATVEINAFNQMKKEDSSNAWNTNFNNYVW